MELEGKIKRIRFRAEDTGYTVFVLAVDDDEADICGYMPTVIEGENIICQVGPSRNKKYPDQYTLLSYKVVSPNDEESMISYLSCGIFPGIGKVRAERIVKMFGVSSLKVIEESPTELARVKGISKSSAKLISDGYKNYNNFHQAFKFFTDLGLTLNFATKICDLYGEDAATLVTENPYRLIKDVQGVGFKKADEIAKKLGIKRNSPFRINAVIRYILDEFCNNRGDTYIKYVDLINEVLKYVDIQEDTNILIENEYLKLRKSRDIVEWKMQDTRIVALRKISSTEKYIAERLISMKNQEILTSGEAVSDIDFFEKENHIRLHDNQKEAIETALKNKVSIITGGPGTGKTTIIKAILSIVQKNGKTVCCAAPTGRAAKRMEESTGYPASTIHRLLEVKNIDGHLQFTINEFNKLQYNYIIIDEISMCDIFLAAALLKGISDNSQIVFVGDKDQLPSVGIGNLLGDLIDSNAFPIIYLSKIYRQSAQSLISYNAHLINRGKDIELRDGENTDFEYFDISNKEEAIKKILSLIKETIPKKYGYSIQDIQILSPFKSGKLGVDNINRLLQSEINVRRDNKDNISFANNLFKIGDKVINRQNKYDLKWESLEEDGKSGEGVYNGEIGTITSITKNRSVFVTYEDKIVEYKSQELEALSLAYAISIHKSQGSEFPVVIMLLERGINTILNRRTIYTAITRARKHVYIVAERSVFNIAIRNAKVLKRNTLLKEFIKIGDR